ncbi:MAG: primosomal protein N' [Candidatus Omnitrophica bacterium]|nr:primosomal protein N' [Candidatus Omnitrophota bacterium]
MNRPARYAEVALDMPMAHALSYRIPSSLQGRVAAGQRVLVPLRGASTIGCVVRLTATSRIRGIKPIRQLIDDQPIVSADLLQLSEWIARTYCASHGEALFAMLPGPLRRGRRPPPAVAAEGAEMSRASPSEPRVPPLALTAQQTAAVQRLRETLTAGRHEVFLLHGVTGSGKTEVYLHAIQQLLAQGGDSIVLVPEIALTPQTLERFTSRFGAAQVAVLHSHLRTSQRLAEWSRIAHGLAHVVIGARSALFAPVRQLGLIVLDEEQENTYKQEDTPRYHAREAAIERARLAGAAVILGSATPSLEAYSRAQEGRYTLLTLTERIDRQPMPVVELVDLRRLPSRGGRPVLSPPLETALEHTLADRQQAILFLNRRGFSTFIQCRGCGTVARCPRCQVSLTFHQAANQLVCHHCRHCEPVPNICPSCRGRYVRFRGTGTQRVENELARRFPAARIARMDTDTMRPRDSHEIVLTRFRRREVDILVGTQMVAKGHDFPQVTLIGVVNADTALHLPDFRAAERTFDLLTQVAGRAGRGTLPGRVIVQTALADHPAIVHASHHDYDGFYREELRHRRALKLPPVAALAQLTIRARVEDHARTAADMLLRQLQAVRRPAAILLGPSPSPLYRLRGQYRWQIMLSARTLEQLLARLAPVRALRRIGRARLTIDVDPWSPW